MESLGDAQNSEAAPSSVEHILQIWKESCLGETAPKAVFGVYLQKSEGFETTL